MKAGRFVLALTFAVISALTVGSPAYAIDDVSGGSMTVIIYFGDNSATSSAQQGAQSQANQGVFIGSGEQGVETQPNQGVFLN